VGILEKMRSGQDSTFMQVVMALVIFAFVGGYARSNGDQGIFVAKVNGVPITDMDRNRAYRAEARYREMSEGRSLSDAEEQQLLASVTSSLIDKEVILQEAKRMGLEVSDSEVARVVFSQMKGANGKFDETMYLSFLKREGLTRDDFEETIREDLLRAKLQQIVFLGASTSEPAIREAWLEAQTRLDLTVVRIRPQMFDKDLVVTDDERATWLTENEALVVEAYERDKARLYDHPERVRLTMIRLAVVPGGPVAGDLLPRLAQLRERVAGGEDMAKLARQWSEDPTALQGGDLGLRAVAQIPEEVSSAIASLQPGELSAPITTANDVRLVRLDERLAAKVDAIEDVRNEIADRLIKGEKLPTIALDFAEKELLPKWQEAGAPPQELLASKGVTARPTGPFSLDEPGPLAPPRALLDAARGAAVKTVFPKVYEDSGTLYVAQLETREEPDPAEFESRKAEITAQLLQQRRIDFYTAWVDDLKARASIE
jgi:peptidyl-prolyl cis-trans isomerase D